MVKKAQAQKAVVAPESERVYEVVYDALINPVADQPFKGQVTRSALQAATLDVDDLIERGVVRELGYVPA